MKHRSFALLWATLLVSPLRLMPAAEPAAPTTKPNILIILVDDMGYSDLGCFGSEIQTPNIDRLATGGMKFGGDYTDQNAALLGRSLGTAFAPKKAKANNEAMWNQGLGSFHEKIPLPSGLIDGSGHQLWSAAAFLNVCIRAGLVAQDNF